MRNLPSIEVFQDLSITAVDSDGIALREALANEAKGLWHHDLGMESRGIALGTGSENTIALFNAIEFCDSVSSCDNFLPQ